MWKRIDFAVLRPLGCKIHAYIHTYIYIYIKEWNQWKPIPIKLRKASEPYNKEHGWAPHVYLTRGLIYDVH